MDQIGLSPLARKLIKVIEKDSPDIPGERVSVDQVVSEVASFYEKIRNAMEYQEEEVVFRSAIERILRRRLFFEDRSEKIAQALLKELAWAKYFPDNSIPQALVETIARKIDLYIRLYGEVIKKYKLKKEKTYDFFLKVMSSDIAFIINPNKDIEVISNFMFHIFQKKLSIEGETWENTNALIFINIKRALAKEDKAFLRYDLFIQYFGKFNEENYKFVLDNFLQGYQKIEQIFYHPLNDRIFSFIKRKAVPFIIMKDVFDEQKGKLARVLAGSEYLTAAVVRVCEWRYADIYKKVTRAIIRSVIFLFATKAIFALFIEGSFDKLIYKHIIWSSLIINTLIPSLVMLLSIFFIRIPNRENSLKIASQIKSILFDPQVSSIEGKVFQLHTKQNPALRGVFILLWAAVLFFGITKISLVLSLLEVNFISQTVFIFFMVIVSFLIFRINQASKVYNIEKEKEDFSQVLFDFLFMPFIQLGRRLTLTFSQINIFLIFFDFIIEAPFKTLFAFLEQWFSFLRVQRETLE